MSIMDYARMYWGIKHKHPFYAIPDDLLPTIGYTTDFVYWLTSLIEED